MRASTPKKVKTKYKDPPLMLLLTSDVLLSDEVTLNRTRLTVCVTVRAI